MSLRTRASDASRADGAPVTRDPSPRRVSHAGRARSGAAGHLLSCAAAVSIAALAVSRALSLPPGYAPSGIVNFAVLAAVVLALAWQRLPAHGFSLANALTLVRGGVVALLAASFAADILYLLDCPVARGRPACLPPAPTQGVHPS